MVLYQKIFISEVIPTLKPLLFLLPALLFSISESELNTDNNLSIEQNLSEIEEENIETQDSFLSSVEYGAMLYKSPRGISCAKCHGEHGQGGQKIAKYYDKNRNPKLLKGVDITQYTFEDLKASIKNDYMENNRHKYHKIMPMYYLTNDEVVAIYNYLQNSKPTE